MSSLTFKKNGTAFIVGLFLISACTKSHDDNKKPASKKEYFNCYINGEYWEMDQAGGNLQCIDLFATYYKNGGSQGSNPPGYLVVKGTDCKTGNTVSLIMDSILGAGVYYFPQDDYNSLFYDRANATPDDWSYRYDSILTGTVNINELTPSQARNATFPDGTPYIDVTPGWIDGTFEMQLVNDQNDTVTITNGNFGTRL